MKPAFISIVSLVVGIALAQTGDGPLRFDAATVKPAGPQQGNGYSESVRRPPGRYTATNMSLRGLLLNAFTLKDYQLETPRWMDNERYDISAKAPGLAKKLEIDAMAQNLLIERFNIEMHREQREMPIYRLVVAKNGPKLKESTAVPETQTAGNGTGAAAMPPKTLAKDEDGFPITKGKWASSPEGGSIKMTATGMSIPDLVKRFSAQLQRDIIDETGLTGKYDFRLEYADDGTLRSPLGMPRMPRMMNQLLPDPSGPLIFKALQDQIGLKLEPGKAPREVLVIDKAEKIPIEN